MGSLVILCLHSKYHLWKKGTHPSLIPRLMYSASHLFRVLYISASHTSRVSCIPVSYVLRCPMYSLSHVSFVSCTPPLMFFDSSSGRASTIWRRRPCLNFQIMSRIMSRLQATSHNQSCLTAIEIETVA